MKHKASPVVVYETTDYGIFTTFSVNRPPNMNKIKKIIKEVEGGNNMLPYYPINVVVKGAKLDIIDGQNRRIISMKTGNPVYYIIVPDKKSIRDIAAVNSNVEKWTNEHYINCYITNGNPHYKKIKLFIDKYKIDIGTTLHLLALGKPRAGGAMDNIIEQFRGGLYEVKCWKEAEELVKLAELFKESPFHKDRAFLVALYRIREAGIMPVGDLAAAFNKRPEMLKKSVSQKGYVYNLEEIASFNKHKRISLT